MSIGNVAAPLGLPRPVIDAYPAAVGVLQFDLLSIVQVFPDRRGVSPHHRADQDEHRVRGEQPRRLRSQDTPSLTSLRSSQSTRYVHNVMQRVACKHLPALTSESNGEAKYQKMCFSCAMYLFEVFLYQVPVIGPVGSTRFA